MRRHEFGAPGRSIVAAVQAIARDILNKLAEGVAAGYCLDHQI
jgi:hypothetical protein